MLVRNFLTVRKVVIEGRIYGQACKNSPDRYKNACNFLDNQYFFMIFEVLKSSRFPLAFSVVSNTFRKVILLKQSIFHL